MGILNWKGGSNLSIRKPEVLAPAGDLIRLKTAVDFGADAVYLAGESFGMRAASPNFDPEAMRQGVIYAHAHGVKVHVTCNTIPHVADMKRLPDFIRSVDASGADAVIVSDLGTMQVIRQLAPRLELHMSVQAGIVNAETANAYYQLGAKRCVLAREMSLEEIAEIRANTPPDLELEAFVHGAMCVSFSARCLLSNYMTGRDANGGECAQPCRWSYSLVEEKRPGEYYDITNDEKGTYILNANDLCMAPYLDRLAQAGIDSFKIEGRAKSEYYTAVVTRAYRGAVDAYLQDPEHYVMPPWVGEELEKISHRTYSTGFFFGRPNNAQSYDKGYIRNYLVAGYVEGYADGYVLLRVKNKFVLGQELDCLEPGSAPFTFPASEILDAKGNVLETANHAEMLAKVPYDRPIRTGALVRIKNQ